MSRSVEIPGGTATLRDVEELTGRQSDMIEAATMSIASVIPKVPVVEVAQVEGEADEDHQERVNKAANQAFASVAWTLDESTRLVEWRRAIVFATLASWTLDLPLPKTADELADLPRSIVQALNAAVGGTLMQVGTDYTSPDTDPDGPTTDCGSLSLPSKGDPQSNQIPNSSESTATTSIDESIGV